MNYFPTIDEQPKLSNFYLRLNKNQQNMYKIINKNYYKYKNYIIFLSDLFNTSNITYDYGINFLDIDLTYKNRIIFKIDNIYIDYEDNYNITCDGYLEDYEEDYEEGDDFLKELISYLLYYNNNNIGYNISSNFSKYNYILDILTNPAFCDYSTYMKIKEENQQLKTLFDNINNTNILKNYMEEYISIICPIEYENILDINKYAKFIKNFNDLSLIVKDYDSNYLVVKKEMENSETYISISYDRNDYSFEIYINKGCIKYVYFMFENRGNEKIKNFLKMIWKKINYLFQDI